MKNRMIDEKLPSAAKADTEIAALTARLKPCPFKATSFCAHDVAEAELEMAEAGR